MAGAIGLQFTYSGLVAIKPVIIPPRSADGKNIITSINEGQSITFTTTTTQSYANLIWGIVYQTTNSSDYTGSQGGTFNLTNYGPYRAGLFNVTAKADLTTEGIESFRVFVRDPITANIISYSPQITINDTSINPPVAEYTSPGTYSWTCPSGVTSVNVVCIGGGGGGGMATSPSASYRDGGGGGGGGLGWKNNISVTPGQSYTVVVGSGGNGASAIGQNGSNGGNSYFINTSTVCGFGGRGGSGGNYGGQGGQGGPFLGGGGGNGGGGGGGSSVVEAQAVTAATVAAVVTVEQQPPKQDRVQ
jgi:hypothetical protein